MGKPTHVTQPLSASGLAALEQVAAALELAHAEARAREEAVPSWIPAIPMGEWQGLLARIDDHGNRMARRLDDITQSMKEHASFLESEEHICRGRRGKVQESGEKLARLAAHSLS